MGYAQKINAISHMFCDACTDCYILYRVRQYLIAFWGIFIFVGCVAFGAVFADLCNKKRNSQKKSNCFSSILLHRGYNPNHPHKLQKAAVSQSDSPTQRPFRFWLRLTTSVHRRLCVPRRPPAPWCRRSRRRSRRVLRPHEGWTDSWGSGCGGRSRHFAGCRPVRRLCR